MSASDEHRTQPDGELDLLRRWEDSGGVWRVVSRTARRMTVVLLTCDAGEEMGRIDTGDAAVIAFVGPREGSDEPPCPE